MIPSLKDKFRGAIIGTAIGDALGAPFETMFADDIKKLYPEFSENNCRYVKAKTGQRAKEGIKPGSWTDDTQLMIPIINSIIDCGGINPKDIANAYANVYETEERRGWGRSTIESVKRLSEGAHWFEASENCIGTGNGAAMKAAPLGLVLSYIMVGEKQINLLHCCNSIIDVCKITHKEIGIKAGFLQAVSIACIIFSVPSISSKLWIIIKKYESDFFNSNILSNKIKELTKYKTVEQIAKHGGLTSRAEESWPTVMAIYCNFSDNPITTLFNLIKEGGDSDTTGAMFGALIGAKYGYKIFPDILRNNLEKYRYLLKIADELYETII